MSALSIEITDNKVFAFTPASGKAKGATNIEASYRDDKLTFRDENGNVLYPDVVYTDVSIVSGETTYDSWTSAADVVDKINELKTAA